jgi:hypothetical protein
MTGGPAQNVLRNALLECMADAIIEQAKFLPDFPGEDRALINRFYALRLASAALDAMAAWTKQTKTDMKGLES